MENYKQVASIPDRLREAMRDAGKKQVDLVRETGLDKSSISNYLSGKYEPKSKAVGLLGRALGVSEMWLWGYDVPKKRSPEQIKNDHLAEIVVRLRKDPEFFEVVVMLSKLPAEQYTSIKQLVSALASK